MRDRSAALIVQAVAYGILDCDKIDPYDNRSKMRTRLLVQEADRRVEEKKSFADLLKSLAMMTTSHHQMIDPRTRDIGEHVQQKLVGYFNSMFPTNEVAEEELRQDVVRSAISNWEQVHGVAIDGPEVAETARKLEEFYKKNEEARVKQLEDERELAAELARRRMKHGR